MSIRDPLARAFQLLRWLGAARQDSFGVREVAAALSVAPSTAHNLLSALVEENVLQHDEASGRYMVGMALFQLSHQLFDQVPLRRLSMPHLSRLVGLCNEAAHTSLYVRERGELVTVAGLESSHTVRYVIDMYSWRPLDVGAAGRAVLAFLPAAEREAVLEQRRARGLSSSELADELERIGEHGYALTRATRIEGAVGLAAPVFAAGDAVVGAIGVALPEQRFDERHVQWLADPLVACAHAVTQEIIASADRGPARGRSRAGRRAAHQSPMQS